MAENGKYGPGFLRMARRAGPMALEALRQDTLSGQRRALVDAAAVRPVATRDRDSYRDYPSSKQKGKKK